MYLQKYLVPTVFDGSADGRVGCSRRAKIKKVDAVVYGLADDGLDLLRGRFPNAAHTQTENAEGFMLASVR